MSMYELIKPEEIKMIDAYRKDHGPVEIGNPKGYCDTEYLIGAYKQISFGLHAVRHGGRKTRKVCDRR